MKYGVPMPSGATERIREQRIARDFLREQLGEKDAEIAALRSALDAAVKRADDAEIRRASAVHDCERVRTATCTRAERAEADLAAMTADRDQLALCLKDGANRHSITKIEKNAALARVAELEAQRDEARRMFCEAESVCSEGVKTARDEALVYWPDQADILYPPDGR
ncbi:MAG: hypothetical protein M0R22_13115 [Dehalococcoidia bacterium]|jgi:hypothetical protein|nr:hypothetical protein [Dehalococcoidia bacterium]